MQRFNTMSIKAAVCVFDLPTYMTTDVHVDFILTCFFSCKDRASERHRPQQRKKKTMSIKAAQVRKPCHFLSHQTRKHETYLPRLSGTKQGMDAPDGQQFEPTSTCMPWSSSMDHNSKRYMRLPKNTPRVAKAMTNPSNTEPSHKNFPPCHHNSRQSCYTVCHVA